MAYAAAVRSKLVNLEAGLNRAHSELASTARSPSLHRAFGHAGDRHAAVLDHNVALRAFEMIGGVRRIFWRMDLAAPCTALPATTAAAREGAGARIELVDVAGDDPRLRYREGVAQSATSRLLISSRSAAIK